MKIGKAIEIGELPKLNKWYFGMEIRKCAPTKMRVFQPYFLFWCVKWIQFSDYNMGGTTKEIKKGGWKFWEFPRGIYIEIIR